MQQLANFKDTFQLEAAVQIFLNKSSGRVLHFEDKNLIVNSGKVIALTALFPTSPGDSLSYAKVGNGGATDPEGLILKTPVATMTDLYSPVAEMPISKLSQNVAIPSITMLASLDNSLGNGYLIDEAGFFSGTGLMFNIKVFPGVQKDDSFSIDFVWVITVS